MAELVDVVIDEVHSGTIYLFDGLDQPVIGEAGNIQYTVSIDGAPVTKTVTITEVDDVNRKGEYKYELTPDVKRNWYIHFIHPTYDPVGWEANLRVVDQIAEDITLENLGPGNRVVEVTVEDDGTGDPIVGVYVEVYNETSTAKIAFLTTDSNGKATFQLFDGNYKVYLSKIGSYVFTVPEDLVVSAGVSPPPDVQVTYLGTLFSPCHPPTPDTCVVYGWEIGPDTVGLEVEVRAQIMASNYFLQSNPHVIRYVETMSDPTHANGAGYWELIITKSIEFAGDEEVTYKFSIDDKRQGDYAIPDVGSIAFKDLIGL